MSTSYFKDPDSYFGEQDRATHTNEMKNCTCSLGAMLVLLSGLSRPIHQEAPNLMMASVRD